jgi:hypothetical protein
MYMCLFLFGLSKRCWLYTYCIRYPTLRRQRFKDSRIRSIRNGYRRMCESQSIIASPFAKCYMSNVTAANTYTVSFKFLQGRVTSTGLQVSSLCLLAMRRWRNWLSTAIAMTHILSICTYILPLEVSQDSILIGL